MADRINFDKKINDSVQVGDELYWGTVSGTTVSAANLVGTIINVGKKYVEVTMVTLLLHLFLTQCFLCLGNLYILTLGCLTEVIQTHLV